MYLAVIFGGKLPPKIAPKTKIAVIIVVNYYCKIGCSQRESNPQLALRSDAEWCFSLSRVVKLSQGKH